MSHQNQTTVEASPYVNRICAELSQNYSFSAEELRQITDWGFVVRAVFDSVPIDRDIETYEFAWYLRGERADLDPSEMFKDFPQQHGVVPEEELALLGVAHQAEQIRQQIAA